MQEETCSRLPEQLNKKCIIKLYNNILSKYYYIMFDEYTAMTNYMTYDSSSLNQYSYKNLNDNFPVYNMKIFIIIPNK